MKRTYLTLTLFLISIFSFSQETDFKSMKEKNENKPELFNNDEKNININNSFFNKVFFSELGDTLDLDLTPNIKINGTVTNALFTNDFDIISISCLNIPGLRLLMSRKHFDTEEEYFGVTISMNHKDGLKLEKNKETGYYQWVKKEMSEIIPD